MPPLQEAKWDLGEDDAPGILSSRAEGGGKEEAELAFGFACCCRCLEEGEDGEGTGETGTVILASVQSL